MEQGLWVFVGVGRCTYIQNSLKQLAQKAGRRSGGVTHSASPSTEALWKSFSFCANKLDYSITCLYKRIEEVQGVVGWGPRWGKTRWVAGGCGGWLQVGWGWIVKRPREQVFKGTAGVGFLFFFIGAAVLLFDFDLFGICLPIGKCLRIHRERECNL